jgi:hypothetical protein
MNSIYEIHRQNDYFFGALSSAQPSMEGTMATFSSTFSPIFDESKAEKITLDILGLGFALFAAPMWNSCKHRGWTTPVLFLFFSFHLSSTATL